MKTKVFLGLVLTLCFNYLFSQCTNNAVVKYPFTGNANDLSGNNLNGVVYGATLIPDRFGNSNSAYYFDGIDDYIEVAHNAILNFGPSDNFSISLWIKPDTVQNYTGSNGVVDIISKWTDNGAGNSGYPFSIRYVTEHAQPPLINGSVSALRFDQNCSNFPYDYSTSSTNDNSWHHIVMVKDNSVIKIYVDNVLEKSFIDNTSCSTSNFDPMWIGGRSGNFNPTRFTGAIDDIYIYSCSLDSTQIDSLFNSQDTSACTTIIADYPFTGNANDVSGNNLNGVVNGATLVADRFGSPNSAYYFDGVNDYIEVAHNNLLNFGPNDDFTVSLWVKPSSFQNYNGSNGIVDLISKWTDNGNGNSGYPFAIRYVTQYAQSPYVNGTIVGLRYDKNCSNFPFSTTNNPIDTNWHKVVMMKSGNLIKIYVDNVLETTFTDNTSCSTTNMDPMWIGGRSGSLNPTRFTGAIDDIKIYACADSLTLSIIDKNIFNNDIVSVFPNPTENIVNLKSTKNILDISIYDIQGKLIINQTNVNKKSYELNLSPFNNGLYLIKVNTIDKVIIKKILKTN